MTNLVVVADKLASLTKDESINYWSHIRNLCLTKKIVSFYFNGEKYFLICFRNKIFFLSELKLCFICFTTVFFMTAGVKRLYYYSKSNTNKYFKKKFKKYIKKSSLESKQKILNIIRNLRGGQDDLLGYEQKLDITELGPANLVSNFLLTNEETAIKGIIQKCIKPDRFYRIINPQLVRIINKMVVFEVRTKLRIISYDVFVLALIHARRSIRSDFIGDFVWNQTKFRLFEYLPLFVSIGVAFTTGLSANVFAFQSIIKSFAISIPTFFGFFGLSKSARFLLIDCENIVAELPTIDAELLEPKKQDTNMLTSGKISFKKEDPYQSDIYVSTDTDSELYFELDTLGGSLKQRVKVNGSKVLEWCRTKTKSSINACKRYVPLKYRTNTMSNVMRFDETRNRISKEKIIDAIQTEQIWEKINS